MNTERAWEEVQVMDIQTKATMTQDESKAMYAINPNFTFRERTAFLVGFRMGRALGVLFGEGAFDQERVKDLVLDLKQDKDLKTKI